MDPTTAHQDPTPSLGDLAEAVGSASAQTEPQPGDEPLRRKRRHRKHRSGSSSSSRSRSRSSSIRLALSQQVKASIAIGTAIVAVLGSVFAIYHLYTENSDLRARLARETKVNKEKIVHLENVARATRMQEYSAVELDSEKFNTTVPFGPTPVPKPKADTVLAINLRIPPGAAAAERWEIILRDQLMNVRSKTVSQVRDNRISLALSNLDLDRYEIHAKPRGQQLVYRYMFALR